MNSIFFALLVILCAIHSTYAGPLAYAACQTACNRGWVSCYSSADLVAGATGDLAALPAAVACNVAQGVCMASCVALLTAPSP
ncbi:6133_t:CDS:2 [Ambispora leptoticha]|uniref:6133_t:CDS:1 n=1 Tax=Ambispora leptoticha TaxID=144679 RepID=A0A9N8ZF26_9GLOM|nr:6133_t:CDS:2 [Ambispora leptoticha]